MLERGAALSPLTLRSQAALFCLLISDLSACFRVVYILILLFGLGDFSVL